MMTEVEMRLRVAECPKINLQIREANTDVIRFYIGFNPKAIVFLKTPFVQFLHIKTEFKG